MDGKDKKEEIPELEGTIADADYSKVMSDNFLLYAWSTLLDRALPQIDGLIPVQRRILLAMHNSRLTSTAPYKKSASIVGDTMGKYHPHGDSSIYGALVRMSQDFSFRVPLVQGQGNFGSVDGIPAAAMRYTEARMTPAAEKIVADLHKENIPDYMTRNFDESEDEPIIMPLRFPNLLINGSYGIATGMTAFFLPHNPGESLDLCCWRLKNPQATVSQARKKISGPDFPTGGLVVDNEELKNLYTKGSGSITMMGKLHIEKGEKGKDKIVITELPYRTSKGGDSGVLSTIEKKYEEGKFPEIEDVSELSGEDIRIEIDLKRNVNAQQVLQKLLKETELQKTERVEMNCVIGNKPKTINLLEIVDYFLDFRRYVVIKRAEKRIKEIDVVLHRLEAYMAVIGATDKVVKIIKEAEDRAAAKPKLKKLLKIDDLQAQLIVEMQLGSLTKLDSYKIEENIKTLNKEKAHLKKFIKTPDMVTDLMIEEFNEIKSEWKKEGFTERKTSLISPDAIVVSSDGEGESNGSTVLTSTDTAEECTFMISDSGKALCAGGTFKRGGSLKLKADEKLVCVEPASTNEEWLVFGSNYNAYRLRLAEVEFESKRVSGTSLSSIIGLEKDEKVVGAVPLTRVMDGKLTAVDNGEIFFVTKEGMVKRSQLSEFVKANSAGIKAGGLKGEDQLLTAVLNPGYSEVLISMDSGKGLRFKLEEIRVMGRTAGGVKGVNLKGSNIIGVNFVPVSGGQLVVIHDNDLAKRFSLDQINSKGRGGQGVTLSKVDENKFEKLTTTLTVEDSDKEILIENASTPGKANLVKLSDIAEEKISTTAKPGPEKVRKLFIVQN